MNESLVITKLIRGIFIFIFTKEMAEKLGRISETARLMQKEVVLRIAIKSDLFGYRDTDIKFY